jgi:phage FluMu gp28-like protein
VRTGGPYFLRFQREWIYDPARLRICEKGRQIGLSYADSYDSVRKAAVQGGRDVWVMSRDELQAKEYIRYCKRWAKILDCPLQDLGEQLFPGADGKAIQAQVLRFASRASIYALSSNPDAIVGKSGHVKLDEFALHKDQRTLYAVAKPVTQWGGTLSLISTHRGINTVFNQILVDIKERGNRMGWSHHRVPIQRAVEDGLVERIARMRSAECESVEGSVDLTAPGAAAIESPEPPMGEDARASQRAAWLARQRAECIDDEQWFQEYCCIPADENTAFISFAMLNQCEDEACLRPFDHLVVAQNPLYLGVDVARRKDLCVLDLGEKIGDVVWDRLRIELQNRPFAAVRGELYRLLRLASLTRCAIDATGLGMQLAEEAREAFGWRVEPVTFSAPVKEALAFGLRTDFEQRAVRIAADDKLRADLRGIKKEVSLSGNIRFAGEGPDSHCDRFWALALRQHAARYKPQVWAMVG